VLQLLVTDAFAAWYGALPATPAEDVAATLEVIAQLGTGAEAPGSSEWLLWYEHPSMAGRAIPDIYKNLSPEIVKFSQDWGRFHGYVNRVMKHLDSPAFKARLARLDHAEAAVVSAALERIRRLRTTRLLAVSDYWKKLYPSIRRGTRPEDAEALMRLADVAEVREAYLAALAGAGFEVADVPAHTAALREIALRSTPPGLRLLYGIDAQKNRGLVVLGEWLDRSFYGDSVRRAEVTWAEFLDDRPLSTQPAAPR
jgi:hypothetical protein